MVRSGFGTFNSPGKSKVQANYNGQIISAVTRAALDSYSNKAFQDHGRIIATVLRVEPFTEPQAGSWIQNFFEGEKKEGDLWIQVKARVPFLHSNLPDPFDENEKLTEDEQQARIDLHPTYVCQKPVADQEIPSPFDLVEVDYLDRINQEGPMLIARITEGQIGGSSKESAIEKFSQVGQSNLLAVKSANGGVLFNKDFAVTDNPCLVPGSDAAGLAGCADLRSPKDLNKKLNNLFAKGNSSESGYRYKSKVWSGSKGKAATFCNFFVQDATSELGVGLPVSDSGRALLANEMVDYFETGKLPDQGFEKFKNTNNNNQSWKALSEADAKAAAARGVPVVVGWKNRPGRPGHVAMMRPNGNIANVGKTNFQNGPVSAGFGKKQVKYYVHQE